MVLASLCAVSLSQPSQSITSCLSKNHVTNFSLLPTSHSHFNTTSYYNLLQFSLQNLRFSTLKTPKPSVIILPKSKEQLVSSFLCSKKNGYEVRIRSGGHSYEGISSVSTDGKPFVIIDMMNLDRVEVNLRSKTAWVEGGATTGQVYYNVVTQSKGVYGFSGGNKCWSMGFGGHVLGGGFGFLSRKYGLAADNVVDALLVSPTGKVLDRAAMGVDVFWAIRGVGGGSLGIVYAWKINLVKVPPKVTTVKVLRNGERGTIDDLKNRFVRNKIYFKAKSDYVTTPIPIDGVRGVMNILAKETKGHITMDPYGGKMARIANNSLLFLIEKVISSTSNILRATYINYLDLDLGEKKYDDVDSRIEKERSWALAQAQQSAPPESVAVNFNVTIRNPNHKVTVHYDSIECAVFYKEQQIGGIPLVTSEFDQESKSTVILQTGLGGPTLTAKIQRWAEMQKDLTAGPPTYTITNLAIPGSLDNTTTLSMQDLNEVKLVMNSTIILSLLITNSNKAKEIVYDESKITLYKNGSLVGISTLQGFFQSGIVALALWLDLRHQAPSFTIVNVSVPTSNGRSPQHTDIYIDLDVNNQNNAYSITYDYSVLTVKYAQRTLGETDIVINHQPKNKKTSVTCQVIVDDQQQDVLVRAISKSSGEAMLMVELKTGIRYHNLGHTSKQHNLKYQETQNLVELNFQKSKESTEVVSHHVEADLHQWKALRKALSNSSEEMLKADFKTEIRYQEMGHKSKMYNLTYKGLLALALWLDLRPQTPTFTIVNFSVPTSADSEHHLNIDIQLAVKNPNKVHGIIYNNSLFTVNYDKHTLGQTHNLIAPGFQLPKHKTNMVSDHFDADVHQWKVLRKAISNSSEAMLKVELKTEFHYHDLGRTSRKLNLRYQGQFKIGSDGKISGEKKVKLS
uniref:FAD-binding PCMH-type domain-containing protein n=1 Tax=Chenopodium quinoa TaxID=63459 RepID=A0A803M238_CHEQI